MKRAVPVILAFFLLCAFVPSALAVRKRNEELVQGQVVTAQKRRIDSPEFPSGGSNLSDAPLTSRYYEFAVSIRVGCTIYTGTYQTPFNYLPLAFEPNRPIAFRLTKHVMYFDSPGIEDIRVHIRDRQQQC